MTAELRTSFRRLARRLLPIACLLLLADLSMAQTSANYCEASPAVKEEFKRLAQIQDEDLPYKARRQRELAMLQELLQKYPDDFHVQRRYQDTRETGFFIDRDALIAEYREQMKKKSDDPTAIYLYARILVGRQTKEAIDTLNKLAQQAPDFPWTYTQLAEIYTYPNFRDAAKSKAQLKKWLTKCPESLNGLTLIVRSDDKEMMTAAAQTLRPRLELLANNDELRYWGDLWTLEFKLKPVTQHAEVRKRVAADVQRIREKTPASKVQLETLKQGYKQAGDKAGQRWAEEELLRLLPKSQNTRYAIQTRFYDEHPYPDNEEAVKAYDQVYAQATAEWVKQWPNEDSVWSARVNSLMQLEGTANAEVEAAYSEYAKAHEMGGGWYAVPPIEVFVARFYLKRGFRLESVPALLEKALTETEQLEKVNSESDLYTPSDTVESNLRFTRLEAWPLLVEAYARLKQSDKARNVLDQLAALTKEKELNTDVQKRRFAYGQSIYWQAVGKFFEAEQRKLDALTAYQTALGFRLGKPRKDELSDSAQRLWKELGGTDQGWQAYLARNEASKTKLGTAEASSWDTKNTAMPDFDLTDLQGKKWSLADLKGKVVFINLWATWCGPCRLELPYVQKLREQMKNKKDVVVLTLNTDEEVGMVEPFMKENKYTFPVLLGHEYAESQGVNSIPRNWIISSAGKIMFEGVGFGNNGDEWMKKATEMIEKVKGTN